MARADDIRDKTTVDLENLSLSSVPFSIRHWSACARGADHHALALTAAEVGAAVVAIGSFRKSQRAQLAPSTKALRP